MDFIRTSQDVSHSQAEICLNLWYFVDETGVVLRLAGKAYALVGTEAQKLAALHALSGSDHLTAETGKVPPNFTLHDGTKELNGAIPVSSIHLDHAALFGPLMDQIESKLGKPLRSTNTGYETFDLKLPPNPLCVTTAVYERPNGELIARISQPA